MHEVSCCAIVRLARQVTPIAIRPALACTCACAPAWCTCASLLLRALCTHACTCTSRFARLCTHYARKAHAQAHHVLDRLGAGARGVPASLGTRRHLRCCVPAEHIGPVRQEGTRVRDREDLHVLTIARDDARLQPESPETPDYLLFSERARKLAAG